MSFHPTRCVLGLDFWGVMWGTQLLPIFFCVLMALVSLLRKRTRREFFLGSCVLIAYLKFPDSINMLLQGAPLAPFPSSTLRDSVVS